MIVIIFGIIIRLTIPFAFPDSFYNIISEIVVVNLALAIFNLIPIPPLDGSKILFSLFPDSISSKIFRYEQYSLILLLVFIFFFSDYLYPVLAFLFHLVTGLAL